MPARGHLRYFEDPFRFVSVARENSKDVTDSQIVAWPLHYPDFVPAAERAFDSYPQVGAGAARFGEPTWKAVVLHAHRQPPAWHPGLRDFEHGAADLPPLSDEGIRHIDSFRGEILTELAVLQ